uniref:WKF domain-containing protein n=1 Tax=Balaenoptera musculus TaxID=9771 RepID=A0A8C0DYA0_BALMU
MRRRPGRSQQARFPGCRGWRWGVGTEPVVGRRVRVNCTAWFSCLPCGDLPGSPGHCAVRRATGRPLGGGSASATRRPSCGPGSARSPGLGLPLARRSLPLPRPGPRGSRRPHGLGGRGGPLPPTPVQGRPRPPPDPAPPGVPPIRPAARLRHRPAGWIWFQPSLAGLTCAVRECCGGREVPRSRAHLAAWDVEGAASPEEQRVLERKLKKERKKEARRRLQEAGVSVDQSPAARRSGAALALDYLCSWAQQHKNWRFQKTRQTWLLLHMYDRDQVPDEHFSTLLAYLEGLRGRARELTVQKAEVLMRELDEAGADAGAPLPGRTQRVRQVCEPRNQGAVGKQSPRDCVTWAALS